MSFIIACLMIFFMIGVVGKEKAIDREFQSRNEMHEVVYSAWKNRNTDTKLAIKLMSFIDDEENYDVVQKEMTAFLNSIPEWSSCVECGFPLYPHQCSGTKSERERVSKRNKRFALIVMMANRGKVYQCLRSSCDSGWLKELIFVDSPGQIKEDVFIQRYKWYEEALINGGMLRQDAEIYYVPPVSFNAKTNKMEVVQDAHVLSGDFMFKPLLTNYEKQRAKRLW